MMEKLLISACLVGEKVTYKGTDNFTPKVKELQEKYDLVLFCPEVEGGLKVPRMPSEIVHQQVIRKDGKDVTREYELGANKAVMLCKYLGITKAVLKEKSPACGTHLIHDGTFSDKKIPGMGVAARKLTQAGIRVFSEDEIDKLL